MCHQRPATGPFEFHRHQLILAAEDFAVWERTKAETLIVTCGVRLRRAGKGLGGERYLRVAHSLGMSEGGLYPGHSS